jgi:hypothetical protein
MNNENNGTPKLYALLIGIDYYLPNELPGGGTYPSLGGCVRDINHVEKMLRDTLGLTDERIIKLTATNTKLSGQQEPPEPKEQWPTYENMVGAFKNLTALAQPGDQVYVHYSGHGGRSSTMFPKLKGEKGLDESLVPLDIGAPGTRYLRDLEMSHLIKAMTGKGLLVTLILDSCHSGGATRGGVEGAAVRGIPTIDTRKPPQDSLVAPLEELARTWSESTPSNTRSVSAPSGWLPEQKGYVMLAACRANELANEFPFDGKERNGALTYWLLDALKQNGPGFTYRMLYNRIMAKVHAKFVDQTPQLEGEGNREVFGSDQVQSQFAVNVLKVEPGGNRVLLNTGKVQGLGKGAQFAIYPGNADISQMEGRLALAELEDSGNTDSWAKITERIAAGDIQEGAQAVLVSVGVRMRGRVRLASRDGLPEGVDQQTALQRLENEITKGAGQGTASTWVRLATKDEATDFQVAVNAQGEYEIWDPNGSVLPNLRPALKITDNGAAAKVLQRLVHLTKYRNIRMIDNTDPGSTLARSLVIELGTRVPPKEGEEGFGTFGEVLGLRSRPLSVGEIIFLRITNKWAKPVNLTVLDLQPDWGISQVYPPPGGEDERDYELLEPGEKNALLIPVQTSLPEGYQNGTDIIKAIAAEDGMSFRWLELPALDQPVTRAITKGPSNPLEALMAAFGSEELTRAVIPLTTAKAKSWGTTEVEIKVRRPTIAHVPDPALSLLQSAFDEVVARNDGATKSRSVGGREEEVKRPEVSDPVIKEVSQLLVAINNGELSEDDLPSLEQDGLSAGQSRALAEAQERGVVDTVKYCASMAAGVAKNLWAAKVRGDTILYAQYKDALTKKFGDCDPNYREAVLQYVNSLANRQEVPYIQWKQQSDFVVEDEAKLPTDAVVGVVADWGTGEPEAIEVLRQVKRYNPHVAMHLGDIYYAGTEHEVENYFYQPWKKALELDTSNITSFVLPGNHDLYAGGKPFYALAKRFGQGASFFCIRNQHWQLIGLDTALNDKLAGKPTYLHESEVKWLVDKMENAGGRRTILLSHHQLFSTNEQFEGKSYNQNLYDQLSAILPQVDLWLWGHEHDLVIFDEYKGLKRGRCVGGSAFPVGNFEMPKTHINADVPFNKDVELGKGSSFYQHCYAIIKLDGPHAKVLYYEDTDGGKLLYTDEL